MDPETEAFCQEYLVPHGTVVKPYYWLNTSQACARCPYHIRTGEQARVPYAEFHQAFGFPYGPTHHQSKHLLFYEVRHFSGKRMQKGHATNCTENDIHPESMLFETGGYLDSVVHNWENAMYIILYSNYSPCNEAEHCCISKIYRFLMKYPGITLCIYFSQLYHTEEDLPVSPWNCEALQSLASLWPQVTLNPLCGGLWHSVLHNFVTSVPQAGYYRPILPIRALTDRQNAQHLNNITGMRSPFMKALPQPIYGNASAIPNLQNNYMSALYSQHPVQLMNSRLPPLRRQPLNLTPPMNVSSPWKQQPLHPKPRNIVRHLKMPNDSLSKVKHLQVIPKGRAVHMEKITKQH
nr:putative C->U-editing enzyme APOBEC-4 [Anolis sagrei ordinatus]